MIHRIRIQNFKSIRDVTVDLEPLTVIVGPSGVGKTNFLSAIKCLREFLRQPGSDTIGRFGSVPHVRYPKEGLRFEVEFAIPTYDARFRYVLAVNPFEEELCLGDEVLFSHSVTGGNLAWRVEPKVIPKPNPGQVAIGRLPGMQHVVIAYAALTESIGAYHFGSDVLRTSGRNDRGLGDDGSGFLSVLRDLASNWQTIAVRKQIIEALKHLNPTVESIELDSIQKPTTAIVGHRVGEAIVTLGLEQQSDGFRRFYAHLLALNQTPPKQLLLFEEPENGIHPGALSLLAEEFHSAASSGQSQIVLTTQSPGLLDHFSDEQIRVAELVDLETQIGPLSANQIECLRDKLLSPGQLLTVDRARREVPTQ